MNKTEILVIDDEPQIRTLLRINLESNGYKVILANTAKEGLVFSASHPPDLILLDMCLPDASGLDVLKQLREWYVKPIIILSVLSSENDIVTALDNGATDYLTKPFRTGELLARIRTAIRLSLASDNTTLITCSNIELDIVARTVKKDNEIIKLTQTEYNLLSLFMKNYEKVLTHGYILKEIWGYSYQSETQYLRVFIGAIRKKIEDDPNNPKHIITESGVGYRFQ